MPVAAILEQEMIWTGIIVRPPFFYINSDSLSPQTILMSWVAQEIDIGRKANRLFGNNKFNQSAILIGPFSILTEACYAVFRKMQQQAFTSSAPQHGPKRDPYYLTTPIEIQAVRAIVALNAQIQAAVAPTESTLAFRELQVRSAALARAIQY